MMRDVAGELRPQAFLCTDLMADPVDIPRWFVRRWSIEVTFAEVRRHLGVETQRQSSDPAIARTTPALLGLFSLIPPWVHERDLGQAVTCRAGHRSGLQATSFHEVLAMGQAETLLDTARAQSHPCWPCRETACDFSLAVAALSWDRE